MRVQNKEIFRNKLDDYLLSSGGGGKICMYNYALMSFEGDKNVLKLAASDGCTNL
jgi:hypothetical protein